MNIQTFDPPKSLGEIARRYKTALLSGEPYRFDYPRSWREDEISRRYKEFREKFSGKGNVYAIWTRDPNRGEWVPRYVGQRESSKIAERMRQHLVKRSEDTGSMLDEVKRAVSGGLAIGVSFVMVEPEELRSYVEAAILKLESRLDWNKQGTGQAAAAEGTSGGAPPEPGCAFAPTAASGGTSIEEAIAALRRERAGRPPVSAAEIRAARDLGRP